VPYSKEENSIVERVNREVMRHLRALVFELNDDDNVELFLPLVQRILNNNIGESNGTSPAQLMFGNSINLDRQLFLTKPVTKLDVSLSKWAADMLNTQDKLIKQAASLQKLTDDSNKAKRTKFSIDLPIGSFVLLDYVGQGPPSKFHTEKQGPFEVKKKDGNNITIWDSVKSKEVIVKINRCTPFEYDPRHVDPEDIARRDDISAHIVESVSEHNGDKTKPSQMDFRVRYAGYDESYDQWQPWKAMRNNPALHRYLWDNGMRSLIPKEHRVGIFKSKAKKDQE
jgi:hypothetical protein